uniref:Uncharacterized protein n=1 Tax=Ditylenchus dipsaci TaxID=166011 RepID=A0A915DDD3_9BILA
MGIAASPHKTGCCWGCSAPSSTTNSHVAQAQETGSSNSQRRQRFLLAHRSPSPMLVGAATPSTRKEKIGSSSRYLVLSIHHHQMSRHTPQRQGGGGKQHACCETNEKGKASSSHPLSAYPTLATPNIAAAAQFAKRAKESERI